VAEVLTQSWRRHRGSRIAQPLAGSCVREFGLGVVVAFSVVREFGVVQPMAGCCVRKFGLGVVVALSVVREFGVAQPMEGSCVGSLPRFEHRSGLVHRCLPVVNSARFDHRLFDKTLSDSSSGVVCTCLPVVKKGFVHQTVVKSARVDHRLLAT